MKSDLKLAPKIVARYPDDIVVGEGTIMQIYATHEYTGEPGTISFSSGPINIVSYYAGREKNLYLILLLTLDEDADDFEDGLNYGIQMLLEHPMEDFKKHVAMIFQFLREFPYFDKKQKLALIYSNNVYRTIIEYIRDSGKATRSELKIWLRDKFRDLLFFDELLSHLFKQEIIAVGPLIGLPAETIILKNDIFLERIPPIELLKNPDKRGLPAQFTKEYNESVKSFFQKYHPSEKDNLNIINEVIVDHQVYEILKLLRVAIVNRDELEKLRKKGVDDIDESLKKLWDHQMIHVFEDLDNNLIFALRSDFSIEKKPLLGKIKDKKKQKIKWSQVKKFLDKASKSTNSISLYEILNILKTKLNTENIELADLKLQLIEKINRGIINGKLDGSQIIFGTSIEPTLQKPLKKTKKPKVSPFNIFMSYSTKDTNYFNIPEIAKKLEEYPEINNALYWAVDSDQNIIEYMERSLNESKVFVTFCSENAIASKAVKGEWMAAYQLEQNSKLKIVPVHESLRYIPSLLRPFLNVEFNSKNIEKFIRNLYKEIMRKIESY